MNWHQSQRGFFSGALLDEMRENENIYLLVGDLGFLVFDQHFLDFPKRTINCGAAEQSLIGIAIGLALQGKIPFVYSISTFLIYRPFEAIKLYLNGENIPVKLVGSGRDKDYHIDGPSHDGTDIKKTLDTLLNINQRWPKEKEEIPDILQSMIQSNRPEFISLRR